MEQQRIRVYGAPWCPDCKRSKQFLAEPRVPWESVGPQVCGVDLGKETANVGGSER